MVEQAVALNPNLVIAWYSLGWVTMMCGDAERSIESFDRMIRVSSLDPSRVSVWNGSSFAFFILGRHEKGFVSATKSIQVVADFHTLGAFNAVQSRTDCEAQEAAARLLRLQPDVRASDAEEASPTRSSELRRQIIGALREAGLPGQSAACKDRHAARDPYISTSRPTSTTWAVGTLKYAAGRLALRCMVANRDFLQTAMPDAFSDAITMTRRK